MRLEEIDRVVEGVEFIEGYRVQGRWTVQFRGFRQGTVLRSMGSGPTLAEALSIAIAYWNKPELRPT